MKPHIKSALLVDAGNTHVRVCVGRNKRLTRSIKLSTKTLNLKAFRREIQLLLAGKKASSAMICSVIPSRDNLMRRAIEIECGFSPDFLNASNVVGIGISYPRPRSIGADRLANAIAAQSRFGSPVVVVDFGTAVTFDVVNREGDYVGGIIAPGLSAMTDYLHEKTALLPRIRIREVTSVVGKSTTEAMVIGAVHGYRGLIQGLIRELKRELKSPKLTVVATGGYAALISRNIPEIKYVEPGLTMEGLLLASEPSMNASPTAAP